VHPPNPRLLELQCRVCQIKRHWFLLRPLSVLKWIFVFPIHRGTSFARVTGGALRNRLMLCRAPSLA
jgi:hypothetical protein